ncbi:Fpg/Nei family DNA glycosylase, partial [Acinetobacter baumannii]
NVASVASYPSFLEIAPEPFSNEALTYYLNRIHQQSNKNKPIKQVILDHKVIAGCGNIYACEALFRAGVLPDKKVKDLTHQQQEMVFYYVREVLEEGIKYGGTSISDYRHADGKTGEMQLHLNVYKQPVCKVCGSQIETKIIATRNSHYCPVCQK